MKHFLSYSNSEICFCELTSIFHKRLFIPYLPGLATHIAMGSGLNEWEPFIAPSGLSHFLISSPPYIFSPAHPLLLFPLHLEASLPLQIHETVFSCLAGITCLNRASSHTHLSILFSALISVSLDTDYMALKCAMS